MANSGPVVSVIIPCYKQAHFLSQSVESALAQEGATPQVVVVNDGSPDDTDAVAAQYKGRIVYIEQPNAGLSAARNSGLRACAHSDFVIFLDSDDLLTPNTVLSHLAAARRSPHAGVFYTERFHHVDVHGNRMAESIGPLFDDDSEFTHQLLQGNQFPPHCVMVRRNVITRSPFFDPELTSYEDWDCWLGLAARGVRFAKTPGVDLPYRQHSNSMSTNRLRMFLNGMKVLRKSENSHNSCTGCVRFARNSIWGLRSYYLKGLRLHQASGAPGRALKELVTALLSDPALVLAGPRGFVRRIYHERLNQAHAAAGPAATPAQRLKSR